MEATAALRPPCPLTSKPPFPRETVLGVGGAEKVGHFGGPVGATDTSELTTITTFHLSARAPGQPTTMWASFNTHSPHILPAA